MARMVLLSVFSALIVSGALALKRCSEKSGDERPIVDMLRDGRMSLHRLRTEARGRRTRSNRMTAWEIASATSG